MKTKACVSMSTTAWWLSVRPRTLTLSMIPIFVGTALASASGTEISWFLAVCALLTAVFIQMATNIINDACDAQRNLDNPGRIGPTRPVQMHLMSGDMTPAYVMAAGFCLLFVAFSAAIPLMLKGGIPIIITVVLSIICAYAYTGGPFPMAYVGLGDIFVLLFFGLVTTIVPFYVQTGYLDMTGWIAGLQLGLLSTAVIAMNNTRDMYGDALGGRKTIPVRFGLLAARCEITLCILTPFVLNIFWWLAGFHMASILPILALPIGWYILHNVWRLQPSREYNKYFFFTILLHHVFGLLLGISILLA